jgi:SAM-dependent methyltransferase
VSRTNDPTERFSGRVEGYVRYRPGYPAPVIDWILRRSDPPPGASIADLGSGTGILSRALLERGFDVTGVEPNRAMRLAAEAALAGFARFRSVAGRAESTGLPPGSADLAVAGQAFHWFERKATRRELERILRPPRWLALVWNDRRKSGDPFLEAYEELLREFATDYRQVDRSRLQTEDLARFFYPGRLEEAAFPNRQRFDLQGLKGRLLSSSYAPAAGHPDHPPMLAELERIFGRFKDQEGRVTFLYDTRVYLGRLDASTIEAPEIS